MRAYTASMRPRTMARQAMEPGTNTLSCSTVGIRSHVLTHSTTLGRNVCSALQSRLWTSRLHFSVYSGYGSAASSTSSDTPP